MVNIAITGAAGNIGHQALDALSNYNITPITHRVREEVESIVLDVTDLKALDDAFSGQDIVIHLAGNPSPKASWDSVSSSNIEGTNNVFQAAVNNEVDRVIFSSTNHVTHGYNVRDVSEPGETKKHPNTIHYNTMTRPDSYYAVSKITGEALGSYYADRYDLEVISMRIGWLLTDEELIENQSLSEGRARNARVMWLSPHDCRHVLRRAVEADISENPLVLNVISRNSDRYLSITHTMQSIGYYPQDDSKKKIKELTK